VGISLLPPGYSCGRRESINHSASSFPFKKGFEHEHDFGGRRKEQEKPASGGIQCKTGSSMMKVEP
jgi:hypothetical protein